MADGVPLRLHMLKDTETHIADGVMTFPFTLGLTAPRNTRRLHYEFVDNGLNVMYPDSSDTAQLEEIVRQDGSTEAVKKAKEVLKTLGYDVWHDGHVYPTGTPIISGIHFLR